MCIYNVQKLRKYFTKSVNHLKGLNTTYVEYACPLFCMSHLVVSFTIPGLLKMSWSFVGDYYKIKDKKMVS